MQYLSGCSAYFCDKDVVDDPLFGGDSNCPPGLASNFGQVAMIVMPQFIMGGVMIFICDIFEILKNTFLDPKRLKLPHILCMGTFVFFVYRIESRLEDPGEWSFGQNS